MDAGEVVAIATYGGCKLRGPEGQLPDQRPAATQEYRGVCKGPTAGSLLRQYAAVVCILCFCWARSVTQRLTAAVH